MKIDETLTALSTAVALIAALAAIGAAVVTYLIGKRQIAAQVRVADRQTNTQIRIAHKQITAPMRQAWINSLRDLLGEILGRSQTYRLSDKGQRSEGEKILLSTLENRLVLFINPGESDHSELIKRVAAMLSSIDGAHGDQEYWDAQKSVIELAQRILKAEWNRTKEDI